MTNSPFWNSIKMLFDTYGDITQIVGFTLFIPLVIFYLFDVFFIKPKANKKAVAKIKEFEKDGKYLRDLFIELNNSKEFLRYFIYGKSWKYRIIKIFNSLYNDYTGQLLKKSTIGIKYSLSRFSSITHIQDTLSTAYKMHEGFYNGKYDVFKEEYKDIGHEFFCQSFYPYKSILELLLDYSNAISSNFILLKGSAGNGKTTLVCNIAELVIKLKNPCVLINSRDITKSSIEFFADYLSLPHKGFECTLFLINCLYFVWGKRIFVIIDAINENDSQEFSDSFKDLLNLLSRYNMFSVILTCRNEYFESRYQKLIEGKVSVEPLIYDIGKTYFYNIDSNSTERDNITGKLYEKYKKAFNFNGQIPLSIGYQLCESLFLMRMFFETHRNSNATISTLNRFAIYQAYIEKIANNNPNIDVERIVNIIIDKMLISLDFTDTPMDCIHISSQDMGSLKKIADDHILISKTIKKNEGTITEREQEVFYFTFDEMRDYLISRKILQKDEDNKDSDYKETFGLLSKMFSKKMSPLEGVVKYSYNYFKKQRKVELCKKILKEYSDVPFDNFKPNNRAHEVTNWWQVPHFGIMLILDCGQKVEDFEADYIFDSICKNTYLAYRLMEFFYLEEKYNGIYSFKDFTKIISKCSDEIALRKITNIDTVDPNSHITEIYMNRLKDLKQYGKSKYFQIFLIAAATSSLNNYIIKDFIFRKKGTQLYFNDVEQLFPFLKQKIEEIRKDLEV